MYIKCTVYILNGTTSTTHPCVRPPSLSECLNPLPSLTHPLTHSLEMKCWVLFVWVLSLINSLDILFVLLYAFLIWWFCACIHLYSILLLSIHLPDSSHHLNPLFHIQYYTVLFMNSQCSLVVGGLHQHSRVITHL